MSFLEIFRQNYQYFCEIRRRLQDKAYRHLRYHKLPFLEKFKIDRPDTPVHLFITHQLGGGTNNYLKQRIDRIILSGGHALELSAHYQFSSPVLTMHSPSSSCSFRLRNFDDLRMFLDSIDVTLVVYNNAGGWVRPESVPPLLTELKSSHNAQLEFLLHDFGVACPSVHLLNSDGHFCGIPIDKSKCDSCLKVNRFIPENLRENQIEKWRATWLKALDCADRIVTFSESSKQLISRCYPELIDKILVKPHDTLERFETVYSHETSQQITLGVVGSITYQKGSSIVCELAKLLITERPDIRLVVIGRLIGVIPPKGILVSGPYEHANLPSLLNEYGVNIALVPSVVPETYCYVVRELIELGTPIVCFNLGAQAEQVSRYEKGMVVKEISARTLLDASIEMLSRI
jgi:glycosyltransferase involved in cell wall biosynthesis